LLANLDGEGVGDEHADCTDELTSSTQWAEGWVIWISHPTRTVGIEGDGSE
jgi:hypothetical protein